MLSGDDNTDPEEADAISGRNVGRAGCNGLSPLNDPRVPARSHYAHQHTQLINGRTRSFSRARASSAYDSQSRRRRGSVSPAFGAAHFSFARLLQTTLCAHRARSDGSGRPPAGGLNRRPYPSAYVRPVATFHALDL